MVKRLISFDGTRICYSIDRKSNKFLIFIHGLGGNYTVWRKERSFFHRKNISTIALDLRGHGYSDKPKNLKAYDFENQAKDVYEILKKEKVKKFILLSNCYGGAIELAFSRLYPKLPSGHIFIDTTYKCPKELTSFFNNPFLRKFAELSMIISLNADKKRVDDNDYSKTGDWNLKRILTDIKGMSYKSWFLCLETFSRYNAKRAAKEIKKPTLIIHGDRDTIIDKHYAEEMNRLIKNSKLKMLHNGNHILAISEPRFLEKEIYKFLKEIEFV